MTRLVGQMVATAVLATVALSGCGDEAGQQPEGRSTVVSTPDQTGGPSERPLSSMTPPNALRTNPPKEPSDLLKPVTASGTIEVGPTGCVELVTDVGGRFALLGDAAAALTHGEQVEVQGQPAPQLNLPCEGAPLSVVSVRKLS